MRRALVQTGLWGPLRGGWIRAYTAPPTRRPRPPTRTPPPGALRSGGPIISASSDSKASAKTPKWVPGCGLLRYPAIAWLVNNSLLLCGYQFLLEAGLTGIFGWMLYTGRTTPAAIKHHLEVTYSYPFHGLFTPEDGVYREPFHAGPLGVFSAKTMTAVHTGHNAASAFLPAQVVLIAATFPFYKRSWLRLKAAVAQNSVVRKYTQPPEIPVFMAKWGASGTAPSHVSLNRQQLKEAAGAQSKATTTVAGPRACPKR